jgi:hypothetical protein
MRDSVHRFQLYLFAEGAISTRLEFLASAETEALRSAAILFDACSDVCSSYELWSGSRMIVRDDPVHSGTALEMLEQSRQRHMIDLEEALHSSRWCIAKSARLAQSIDAAHTDDE